MSFQINQAWSQIPKIHPGQPLGWTIVRWRQVVRQHHSGSEILTKEKAGEHHRAGNGLQGVGIPSVAVMGACMTAGLGHAMAPRYAECRSNSSFLACLCAFLCLLTWSPNPSGEQAAPPGILGKREASRSNVTETGLA